jgi:hypothetical protein
MDICFLYPLFSQLGYGSIYITGFPLITILHREWSGSTRFARISLAVSGAGHGSPAKQNYIISCKTESKPETLKRFDIHRSYLIHLRKAV